MVLDGFESMFIQQSYEHKPSTLTTCTVCANHTLAGSHMVQPGGMEAPLLNWKKLTVERGAT